MTTPPTHAELRGQPFPSALGRGGVPPMYATWEEYATAMVSRAEAAERALGDLINDLSDPSHNDSPSHRVAVRSDHDVLASIAALLEELVVEVRRGNSVAREGAVSSVLIEDNPTKDRVVRVSSKQYAGSPLPVDEAIEGHGRAHRGAEARALDGWAETLSDLAEQKAGV